MSTENKKFVVRTKYNSQFKYISLENVSLDDFLLKCKRAFKANWDSPTMKLVDNLRTTIHFNEFGLIIEQFHRSASFFVEIKIENDANADIITSAVIEKHMSENGGLAILTKYSETGVLNVTDRRRMIKLASEYLVQRFGYKMPIDSKIATAKAIVELFPCLKSKGKNVQLYHTVYNTKTGGFLGQKLKNMKPARDAAREASKEHIAIVPISFTPEQKSQMEASINYLKCTMVNESNMNQIREKLVETLEYRMTLMNDPKLDIKETFPFFFASTDLIFFDFVQRFPAVKPNALVENWRIMKGPIFEFLTSHYKIAYQSEWCKEIHEILVLLRLFPLKNIGKNLGSIASYTKSVDKLFIFRKSDRPMNDLCERDNKHPYIIAMGDDKKNIDRFLIDVESHLFDIPTTFSAIEVLDLLFKLHLVLNLEFEPNIEPMMHFLAYFVYNFGDSLIVRDKTGKKTIAFKPINRMQELFNSFPDLK